MYAEKMSFGDALWWSIVTCTTVGYGDYFPTSSIGRIFAVLLMLFGITLIGMLTGSITTYFTKQNTKISIKGRHDSCIVPRAVVVVEAMTILAIADVILKEKLWKN
jgi:chorismate synthase